MRKPFYLLLCVLLNFPHIPSWMKRNYKWVYLPFIGHSPYLCHGILSPLLPRSWGTILVVLALWYLKFSHREFSHFFFFWRGGRTAGFSLLGRWMKSFPHWPKIYSSITHQEKSLPADSPHQIFIPFTKGSYHPLNNNLTSFLAVAIAPILLLFHLHTLCTYRSC